MRPQDGCHDDNTSKDLNGIHAFTDDQSAKNRSKNRFEAKDEGGVSLRGVFLPHRLQGETENDGSQPGIKYGRQGNKNVLDVWRCGEK